MILAHKIELKPTIEQEKYFYKSCAVDRFVYNWALNRYKEQLEVYKKSNLKEDKPNILNFKKEFNVIKHDSFKIFRGVTIKSCFAMPLFYSADISRSAGIIEDDLKTRKIDLTADFEKAVNFLNITKYPYYFNRGR